MHIVFVHFYEGPNPDYPNTVASLRQRGHRVWLGQVNAVGDFELSDGEGSCETLPGFHRQLRAYKNRRLLPLYKRYAQLRFVLRLRRFLKRVNPEIVQVNPEMFPWLIPLAMPPLMKFIFDVKQINMGVKSTLAARVRDWTLGNIWWFTANFIYDYACFDYPLAAERILGKAWSQRATSIPVGIEPAMLTVATSPFEATKSTDVRFIYIGTIAHFRELELLLHAIRQVAATTDQFSVDLIGPDMADGYYQTLIKELGIDHVVTIKPPIHYREIPELLTKYHVGLAYNPARPTWDFQPTIKILEYRAVGLPIISTDVRSHHDFVENDKNGFLVKNRAEAWASAMLNFIKDPLLLARISITSRKIRRGVTHEEVAARHEEVYQKLLTVV